MSAALAEHSARIEYLQAENQAQAAELESLKSRSALTESKVETLTQDKTVPSTYLSKILLSAAPAQVSKQYEQKRRKYTSLGNPSGGLDLARQSSIHSHFLCVFGCKKLRIQPT
ncbi:hypothetical protein WMY93_002115 [Mugilogobius chulae]|uniref:Uncharacterized protein n=1 Tax=Mugilogobius chulae TaxID=88201 RepID=A0AAW0Q3T2_9GOBI